MPLVSADRVKETTTTTGTGSYTLAGAASGFQSFSAGIGNGNLCDYCCTDGTNWEVGTGTLSGGTTLARTSISASSNANAAVSWVAGSKDIFVTVSAQAIEQSRWTFTNSISAAGATQGTATALTDTVNNITTVTAGQGVVMPTAQLGGFISIGNHGADPLLIYPASGETVEALATNAPLTLYAGQMYRACCAVVGNWVGIDVNVWDDEDSAFVMPIVTVNPNPPAADTLLLYSRKVSGRVMPKWMPPSGLDTFVQPALFGNNVVLYTPNTGTTAGINLGTPWVVGTTISHPTPVSTSPAMFNQLKRTRSANVATTTNQVLGVNSIASGAAQFWRGNGAGLGGFFFFSRFSIDLWPAASVRLFVGLQSGTTAVVASDTLPAISMCGLWHSAADAATVLNFTTKDGTTATSTAITLTGALAANQVFDFYMYMKPNDSTIYFRLDDLIAGTTLIDSSKTTNLPATTTFMGPAVNMSNAANGTVTTTAIGVNRIYVESDH